MVLKKFVSKNNTLNTNTTATFPNVTGRMKNESCFPSFVFNAIFESRSAKQRPPRTFRIAESNANETVLFNEELKPFELSENKFEILFPSKPPTNRGNKKTTVIRNTANIISLLVVNSFCILEFQS